MRGLTVNNIHLHRVLVPVAHQLEYCWWYLGGAGMSFPHIRPPRPLAHGHAAPQAQARSVYDPADMQRYLDECRAAAAEYANWIDDSRGYRVGKPGFFGRYGQGMDGGWQTYYVSDSPEQWPRSFDQMAKSFDHVWFVAPPDETPPDICLVTRDVDSAYLDLFFRDDWMFSSVWGYAQEKGMKPRHYKPLEVERGRHG